MLLQRFLCVLAASNFVTARPKNFEDKTSRDVDYDYIVIGSGPGGGPLASRLARAGKRVLLMEAGTDQGGLTEYQVPALSLQSSEAVEMTWSYWVSHTKNTTQQARDSKMSYRRTDGSVYHGTQRLSPDDTALGILYPRAAAVGGCSAHNALITMYPHQADWDAIAALTGDGSWSADKMRQYFVRLENNEYADGDLLSLGTTLGLAQKKGHGYSGWLTTSLTDLMLVVKDVKLTRIVKTAVTTMGQAPSLVVMLISTANQLASVLWGDLNEDSLARDRREGVYQMPIAVKNGLRSGPRDLILQTRDDPQYQLDVWENTFATRVLTEQQEDGSYRATGVEYAQGQSLYSADPRWTPSSSGGGPQLQTVFAAKEVIVSAGAFNTPQLLKLSGIGPAAELASLDIPLVVDLPGVGTNLQDRYETTIYGEAGSDFAVIADCDFHRTGEADPCLQRWRAGGNSTGAKGVYASNGIALALVKRSSSVPSSSDPADLFIAGAPVAFPGYYQGYADDTTANARRWTFLTLKGHTRNRAGTVTLRSADPFDTPVIDFNYWTGEAGAAADAKAVAEGMRFTRKLLDNVGGFTETWPGRSAVPDGQLEDWVRREAWGHHASCSCPIGPDGDPMAVLDSKFRVRGVDGLRVVDASVFPRIPGFFLAVPVYCISEKAADVILADA